MSPPPPAQLPAASAIAIPKMALIPEGWFRMGSEQGFDCERPVHLVWVDAFRLAACQVTNAEYACFLRESEAAPPPTWKQAEFCAPEQPVVSVSWFEAASYCEWLSRHSGGGRYRLPSEAEWERAARGGAEASLYPWGDAPPQSRPGYASRWLRGPEAVGTGGPNPFGLYELCENVHEWCSDWFEAGYYAVSAERNPRGPESGKRRASRGGSWRHHIKASCCHTRSSIPPEFRYADYGFRVACDAA